MDAVDRPFIHVNFAVDSPDRPCASPASISCEADWRRVHTLREQYDAVAVGARTWNLDRPRLTVRAERLGREPARQPVKAIFAGRQDCEIEAHDGNDLFVIGAHRPESAGATLIATSGHDLLSPLAELYGYGIRSMLVEGGPTILRSFFNQGVVDAVTIFVRAGSEDAAHRAARHALPCLPPSLSACSFGEGFLLTGGEPILGELRPRHRQQLGEQ
jgi:riboflavin biosynthesis pyrimidine reductase